MGWVWSVGFATALEAMRFCPRSHVKNRTRRELKNDPRRELKNWQHSVLKNEARCGLKKKGAPRSSGLERGPTFFFTRFSHQFSLSFSRMFSHRFSPAQGSRFSRLGGGAAWLPGPPSPTICH